MNDSRTNSITRWIADLKNGDDDAAAALWERYFHRLIGFRARAEDEEDVAASVFESLCEGAAAGRFDVLSDRDGLWRLLVAITCHKSVDLQRREGRQKRGGGSVRGESAFPEGDARRDLDSLEQFAAEEPSAEFLFALEETFQRLADDLGDDQARTVASMRMEGYSNSEIAEHIGMSVSSVERKLRMIRQAWEREFSE